MSSLFVRFGRYCVGQGHAGRGLRDERRNGLRLRHIDGVTAFASATVAPARFAIARCASGGIIRSSVDTRYQLGFVFHAGSLTAPLSASGPYGTCESAMNAAASALTSADERAGVTMGFRYLGPVQSDRADGERPITIDWRLN